MNGESWEQRTRGRKRDLKTQGRDAGAQKCRCAGMGDNNQRSGDGKTLGRERRRLLGKRLGGSREVALERTQRTPPVSLPLLCTVLGNCGDQEEFSWHILGKLAPENLEMCLFLGCFSWVTVPRTPPSSLTSYQTVTPRNLICSRQEAFPGHCICCTSDDKSMCWDPDSWLWGELLPPPAVVFIQILSPMCSDPDHLDLVGVCFFQGILGCPRQGSCTL